MYYYWCVYVCTCVGGDKREIDSLRVVWSLCLVIQLCMGLKLKLSVCVGISIINLCGGGGGGDR